MEEDIGVLFDGQVIQDDRLLNLETSDIQINEEIESKYYVQMSRKTILIIF